MFGQNCFITVLSICCVIAFNFLLFLIKVEIGSRLIDIVLSLFSVQTICCLLDIF